MSNIVIIILIMIITIGMIMLGISLNYFLGLREGNLRDMRKKASNLRERMKNAQLLGDFQLMAELQQESVRFMKQIMKKQMVPLCVRCLIFIGIFIVLGFIYADYSSGLLPFPLLIFGSGWVAIYLIFSIGFSLLIYGIKKIYKRITGKETKTQSELKEIMEIVSPPQQSTGSPFQISSSTEYQSTKYRDDTAEPRKDSWKDRIEE
ncbi:MAG: EMC3/TMCO1 family protein [Promethearchaeota archaeon]